MSVAGTWNLKIQSPMGEQAVTLEIAGEDALTGSVKTPQGSADVTGTLAGDAVEFKGTLQSPMGAVELTFKGMVDGDDVSGDVQFGSFGSGSWSGTRA